MKTVTLNYRYDGNVEYDQMSLGIFKDTVNLKSMLDGMFNMALAFCESIGIEDWSITVL